MITFAGCKMGICQHSCGPQGTPLPPSMSSGVTDGSGGENAFPSSEQGTIQARQQACAERFVGV